MNTGIAASVPGDVPATGSLPLSERDAEGLADVMAGGALPKLESVDRREEFAAVQHETPIASVNISGHK